MIFYDLAIIWLLDRLGAPGWVWMCLVVGMIITRVAKRKDG